MASCNLRRSSFSGFFALLAPLLSSAVLAQSVSFDLSRFTTKLIHVGGDPDAIGVADVNHDSAADIILANPESGTVTVILGDGKGHFHPSPGSPFSAGHLPSDIGIGDFNGDGNLDLLIPNHQAPYVTMLLGDGKGGFRPAPHSPFATKANPHPHGVAVGHFCGNARPLDAVIDSWGGEQVELLLGDGKGNLTNGPMFPAGPGSDTPLISADFNKDRNIDLAMPDTAIGHWNSSKVSILLGDGECGFHAAPASPFPAGEVPWSAAAGDLNGDGNPDLVIIPYGPRVQDPKHIAATILLGDGRGGFSPMPVPIPLPGCPSPRRVAIGDIAGTRGFIVSCMNSRSLLFFLGEGSSAYEAFSIEIPSSQTRREVASERNVIFADLTRTGRSDIIISNGSAGTVTLLLAK